MYNILMLSIRMILGVIIAFVLSIGLLFLVITSQNAHHFCQDGQCVTITVYGEKGAVRANVYEGKIYSRFLSRHKDYATYIKKGDLCVKALENGRIQIQHQTPPISTPQTPFKYIELEQTHQCSGININQLDQWWLPV